MNSYLDAVTSIDVWNLPKNTRIALTTAEEHYELHVTNPARGVILVASNKRFQERDKAIFLGCRAPDTEILIQRVVLYKFHAMFRLNNGRVVSTQRVLSARVTGPNNSNTYTLWD